MLSRPENDAAGMARRFSYELRKPIASRCLAHSSALHTPFMWNYLSFLFYPSLLVSEYFASIWSPLIRGGRKAGISFTRNFASIWSPLIRGGRKAGISFTRNFASKISNKEALYPH